jgi:hypothetical protein
MRWCSTKIVLTPFYRSSPEELIGQRVGQHYLEKKLSACSVGWWLVADGWCWFILREEYCWLVAGGWFVLREKYCWLVADKPSEQGV